MGDPILRLKNHLIQLGIWSEDQHTTLEAKLTQTVREVAKASEQFGIMGEGTKASDIFEDIFEEMPEYLQTQRRECEALNNV